MVCVFVCWFVLRGIVRFHTPHIAFVCEFLFIITEETMGLVRGRNGVNFLRGIVRFDTLRNTFVYEFSFFIITEDVVGLVRRMNGVNFLPWNRAFVYQFSYLSSLLRKR